MPELIDDCTRLPDAIQHPAPPRQGPREAPPWHVGEDCASRVDELDDYGCGCGR
jgi:hypothetical protein